MKISRALAAASALAMLGTSACTEPEPRSADEPLPYDENLFTGSALCDALRAGVPEIYLLDGAEREDDGGLSSNCLVTQHRGLERRFLEADVDGDYFTEWDTVTPERFAEKTQEASIPVEGLGDEAAFVPTVERFDDPIGLTLYVREDNLLLSFKAYSYLDEVDGPETRTVPLAATAQALVESAGLYLAEIGAENTRAGETDSAANSAFTELPDLCATLAFDGFELAGDQDEWADAGELMDRCHWSGSVEGEELWLAAEAVGPFSAGEMSAEEFAAWWTGIFASAGGESLNLGDESYIISLDPDVDDIEAPATDFVIRVGNVVLQGRYAADPEHSEVDAALLQQVMEQIGSQTEELLHGA